MNITRSLGLILFLVTTPIFSGLDPVFFERLQFWPEVENVQGLVSLADEGNQQVLYRVTFDATWSAATHPEGFPGNPHFSPLIGATHNGLVSFWQTGELASDGIETMAETGATVPLANEIQAAINLETAGEELLSSGINSPSSTSFTFQASRRFPRVTLVTMIAPSPDWFLGISGYLLFRDGRWLEESLVTLYAYDAGTDSGTTYTSPNQDTQPPETIFRINASPFIVNGNLVPLGTYRFEILE